MRGKWVACGIVILTLHGVAGAQVIRGVDRGEVVFKKCYACHSVVPGESALR